MSGVYRKIKNIGNLDTIVDIVDMVHEKGIKVIIEWVKAHEVYAGKDRCWANEYKEKGNQWVDEEAKRQVKEGTMGTEAAGWILQDIQTGKEMDVKCLPKLLHIQAKKERYERLSAPSSRGATNGQGMYMREFVRGSAKCMTVLIKKLRNTGEHYHVLQYAMDRYATRDRIDRWDVKGGSWEAGRCQVCWIRRGINRRQTKEHIWSGRCEGSKNIVQGLERAIQLTCDKGGNSSLFGYVWPVMKEMMTKVNTDSHTLENHECSGALVGIWPNRTFDIVRNKIMQQGGESPHTAQQLTEDLVVTHIKYSIRMMQIWNNVVKEWKTPLTEEET